jgi:hypothetical protein
MADHVLDSDGKTTFAVNQPKIDMTKKPYKATIVVADKAAYTTLTSPPVRQGKLEIGLNTYNISLPGVNSGLQRNYELTVNIIT